MFRQRCLCLLRGLAVPSFEKPRTVSFAIEGVLGNALQLDFSPQRQPYKRRSPSHERRAGVRAQELVTDRHVALAQCDFIPVAAKYGSRSCRFSRHEGR